MPSLPPEALSLIFSFTSRSTLCNLCLCSQQFREIAARFLYRSIDLCGNSLTRPIIGFRPLTRLVLRENSIARLVRHLSIRDSWEADPNDPVVPEDPRDPEPEIRKAIVEAATTEEEKSKWLEDASLPVFEDCIMPLFLSQLTQLETLDTEVPIDPSYTTRQMGRILRKDAPFENSNNLNSLHSVIAAHDYDGHGLEPEHIAWIFRLPKISNVYLHRIGSRDDGNGRDSPFGGLPRRKGTCRSLEMRDCLLSHEDLIELFLSFESLVSICYELGNGLLSKARVSWPLIHDALTVHKDTVRDLRLEYLDHEWIPEPYFSNEYENTTVSPTLKVFKGLKRIAIDTAFLSNGEDRSISERHLTDFLPPQIEYLRITHFEHDGDIIFKSIKALLQQKRSEFLNLGRLVLRGKDNFFNRHKDKFKNLYQQAQIEGVQLVVEHNDGFESERFERKWGFDEDVEWQPCSAGFNHDWHWEAYDLRS
ncbi:MAG: hypothetical protein M1820_004704 [Bogoriella megaspora]|nr:MAG: hypothetical protein M1820_004704 [Bogoriella megaspora]